MKPGSGRSSPWTPIPAASWKAGWKVSRAAPAQLFADPVGQCYGQFRETGAADSGAHRLGQSPKDLDLRAGYSWT